MKLTFKEFLARHAPEAKPDEFKKAMKKKKERKETNPYPVRGARKIVDHSKEKTDSAYRSANSLNSTVSGVGGMGG